MGGTDAIYEEVRMDKPYGGNGIPSNLGTVSVGQLFAMFDLAIEQGRTTKPYEIRWNPFKAFGGG